MKYKIIIFTVLNLYFVNSYCQFFRLSAPAIECEKEMRRLFKTKNSIEDALIKKDTKYITINNYKDSIFPNEKICKLKNIEGISIQGVSRNKKNIIKPHKLMIDTARLKQLPNLKYLYFSYFDLSKFPIELCYFKQLKGLAIEVSLVDTLPDEISNLENLEILELRINYLNFLPKCFPILKNLQVLNLTNNCFKTIPHELTLMKKLYRIDLGNTEGQSEQDKMDWYWPFPFKINNINILAQQDKFEKIISNKNLKEITCATTNNASVIKIGNYFDKKMLKKVWLQTIR